MAGDKNCVLHMKWIKKNDNSCDYHPGCSFYSVIKPMWSEGASDEIMRNCAEVPAGSMTGFSVFPTEDRPPRIPV